MTDTVINFSDGTRALIQHRDDDTAERVIMKDTEGNTVLLAINGDITDRWQVLEAVRVGNLLLVKPKEGADA